MDPAETRPRPPQNSRGGYAIVLPVLYVAGAAVYAGETSPFAWLTMAAGVLVAAIGGRGRAGEATDAARARLATFLGLGIVLAASGWETRGGFVACAREAGAILSVAYAARAIGGIDGDAGLATRASEAFAVQAVSARLIARLGAAAALVSLGAAFLADVLVWSGYADFARGAPVLAATGGALALFSLGAASFLTAGARRLERRAPPRALACAAAAGVALFVAIALAIAGTFTADAAAMLACAAASVAMVRIARIEDALALSRKGRRALTLALFGGPVATLAAICAEGRASGAIFLVLASVAILVGAFAPKLEEPLLPAKGKLLDALADATRAAHDRDAHAAVARALFRLREAGGEGAPTPELWYLYPTRVATVDAAGYVREGEASFPPLLLEVLADEPDATLRIEILRALEVRRPDLRPLLQWLEDRGALFVTLIAGGEEPDGILVAPAGKRGEPLTIEEVHAAKGLADALVAICQGRSARERHMERERDLRDRIEELDDQLARLRHDVEASDGRSALATQRLARPATVGIYSAASRLAYDALERRVEQDAPVVLVARAGIDPVPYVARAHLGGPRKDKPLVVVDGTSSREHDLARWKEEKSSPLALADKGLLVLVDGAALPRDVQVTIARALAERRPPWERAMPLDVAVAFTATREPVSLVESGRLAPELHARFENVEPIVLPGLRDRPEDLHAIVADRLAREGLRVTGKPVGIEGAAFARLVEHPFDGEDAELAAMVTRLVARASCAGRDVVIAADVDALNLTNRPASIPPTRASWPPPASTRNAR